MIEHRPARQPPRAGGTAKGRGTQEASWEHQELQYR